MTTRKDLRRAGAISDAAIKRQATVTMPGDPPIEGRLDAVIQVADRVTFVLVVGQRRAIFQLPGDAVIEVHRAEESA